jgi:hypothetical protein
MSFIKLKEGQYVSVDSPKGKKLVKDAAAKAKKEAIAKEKARVELKALLEEAKK